MQRIYRILIVIILLMILAILALDYFGFHGSILLNNVGNGMIVTALDSFGKLFEGKDAFTNFMFFSTISIGLIVGFLAVVYKFIKG